MKTYKNLYPKLCSYKNLELAFKKASKGKNKKFYVVDFKKDLQQNLLNLKKELESEIYKPSKLKKFTIRDPEIIFIEGEDINGNKTYFPVEFRNDYVGIHQELIIIRDQEIKGQRSTLQKDVTMFANTWLKNIKNQQNLKIKLKKVEDFEKLTSENNQIFPEIIQ